MSLRPNNVSEVAAQIERGIEGDISDLQPRLARGVTFLKDGHVRVHIVIITAVAESLLGDPQSVVWSNAIYYLVYMLAEAYCNIEFDKAFPGVILRPHKSLFNHIRYEPVSTAWTGYIASRFSGAFWTEGIEVRRKLLGDAITNMRSGVPLLGASFKEHQDHGRLVGEIIPYITEILSHAATLAGLADAREIDILEDDETIEMFKVINLAEWYASYVSDLRAIWNKRGQWRSEKDFMSLSRHTERLLWQCGLVLTEAADGQCRIEFPNLPPARPAG